MIEPRIELGTLCVLSICHNQLDHPTTYKLEMLLVVGTLESDYCLFISYIFLYVNSLRTYMEYPLFR